MYLYKTFAFIAAMATMGDTTPSEAPAAASKNFTYDRNHFYIDSEEFIMFGGQIDPQRIPRPYWDQRLKMAKAMGLNTIFSYHYWNEHEPVKGKWDFEGNNDIAAWYQTIADNGLYGVLRPGSYICGERDWGGLPSWLSQIPNMAVRANNTNFLEHSGKYLARVRKELESLLVNNGGPILMIQVENEYGSFDNDHDYTNALADIFRENFDAVLYTNDGGTKEMLEGGHIPGILAAIDGDAYVGFPARDKYITDESCLGPQLNGEYYIKWFDPWNANEAHQSYDGDIEGISEKIKDIEWMVDQGGSFNIYMWHGGTNFGFGNGALNASRFQAFSTSYDYGSPLDETGRPAEIYGHLRKSLAKYTPDVPDIPEIPPLMAVEDFELTPVAGLFDDMSAPKTAESPISMEGLNQSHGYVLYEHAVTSDYTGTISPGDGPRDRIIVYVNGVRKGVIDRSYTIPGTVDVTLKKGDKLGLFVENLGRVDYGEVMVEQVKGIVGDVKIGDETVKSWNMYSFPLDTVSGVPVAESYSIESNDGPPVFYRGTFETDREGMAADTLLELPDGIKGVVWVNGFNLGRYWTIGPQQQLYLPGCYLKTDSPNEVLVLELEPRTGDRVARGLSERTWGNHEDPDCGSCVV